MLLKDSILGVNDNTLELVLQDKLFILPELIKVYLTDLDNKKVNLLAGGSSIVNFFTELPQNTKIKFSKYTLSSNLFKINEYVPKCLREQELAFQGSDYDFFINLVDPVPRMSFYYQGNTLEIPAGADLEGYSVKGLLQKPAAAPAQEIALHKFCDLKSIYERVKNTSIIASCYAIILDCCGSYIPKPGESQDYLISYKITDPSLFPQHANINIFHKDPKEIPKIINFGDVILLNDIQFRVYDNVLQGVIATSFKQMSFNLFKYNDPKVMPYGNYRSVYHPNNESRSAVESIAEWGMGTLNSELPGFFKKSKMVSDIFINEEIDIICKIFGIALLGIHDEDPLVVFVGDTKTIFQLVIPHERKRLFKWARLGDTIRIRSVYCEEKLIYITAFTEILVIPKELENLQIGEFIYPNEISKLSSLYTSKNPSKIVTYVDEKHKKYPQVSFTSLRTLPEDSIVRLEGYVIKIKYANNITITLWSGDNEHNRIDLVVYQENVLEFINGKSIDSIKKDLISYDRKFLALVKIDTGIYRIIHTQLRI
jgi:Telomeric single stranded DNA binding POT1/CDC13